MTDATDVAMAHDILEEAGIPMRRAFSNAQVAVLTVAIFHQQENNGDRFLDEAETVLGWLNDRDKISEKT